jgi:hypothetical protein
MGGNTGLFDDTFSYFKEVLKKTTTKIQDTLCFYFSFRLTVLPLTTPDRSRCRRYCSCSLLGESVSLVLLCLSIT